MFKNKVVSRCYIYNYFVSLYIRRKKYPKAHILDVKLSNLSSKLRYLPSTHYYDLYNVVCKTICTIKYMWFTHTTRCLSHCHPLFFAHVYALFCCLLEREFRLFRSSSIRAHYIRRLHTYTLINKFALGTIF